MSFPPCHHSHYACEEAMMMHHTAAETLGRARIASLRDQARRDALARAARRARRARRLHPGRRTAGLLTVFAGRVLRRPVSDQGGF